MDLLGHLATGFGVALTPYNLLYALAGALVGTLIGVLPGIGPVATTSVSSLSFGSQNVGTTSSAQAVTLTNTGDATLNISSIQIAGDFAQSGNCSSTLAAGANCTLNVTFTPPGIGTRTGFILFSDDSVNGSPQQVSLSGTGSAPAASLSPSSLTFAAQRVYSSSAPQIVTLSNPGNAALSISSMHERVPNPGQPFPFQMCSSIICPTTSSRVVISITR